MFNFKCNTHLIHVSLTYPLASPTFLWNQNNYLKGPAQFLHKSGLKKFPSGTTRYSSQAGNFFNKISLDMGKVAADQLINLKKKLNLDVTIRGNLPVWWSSCNSCFTFTGIKPSKQCLGTKGIIKQFNESRDFSDYCATQSTFRNCYLCAFYQFNILRQPQLTRQNLIIAPE